MPPFGTLRIMQPSDTVVTIGIGILGVAAAASAEALGVPTVWASLLGLGVVIGLIMLRRMLFSRS